MRDIITPFLSRKFLLTALTLGAVFILFGLGKDVRQLELILPAILGFYFTGNVTQKRITIKENNNGSDQ